MNTPVVKKNITWMITKYILGFLGIFGIVLAILTVTERLDIILVDLGFTFKFDEQAKLITSLTSSILGILFLFIAFSRQIDKFFNVIERKEIKLSTKKEDHGLSIELMFFLSIAVVLIVLAVLLGIDFLAIRTELPVLGGYTEGFLIGALIVLAILALVTAFNEIIGQSLKEMKKVHWPTPKQMAGFSAQVFTFIIFFSVLFLVFDLLIGSGLDSLGNLLS